MAFNTVYFLNGIGTLAIALISLYTFFLWFRKKAVCKLGKLIGINGIFYMISTFMNLAWSFGLLSPEKNDFILIEGCFNAVKAVLLLVIVYKLVNNRNLLYFLFIFILSSIALPFYSINTFFLLISATSYLLILIISMDLIFFSNYYLKKAGYMALVYSIISSLFLVFISLGREPSSMLWFIPNTAMFGVFLLFYYDIRHCGIAVKAKKIKRINISVLFIKFLIFIISMNAFIFLSTLSVHELGHTLAAQYYGCEKGKAVIYDIMDRPHTEIVCKGYYNDVLITLGGVALTVAVGLIFLMTGGKFTTIISCLIFGFSLLISYGDLRDLGVSTNIIAVITFISLLLIIKGVIELSLNYIKQQSSFYSMDMMMEESDPEKYLWLEENSPVRNLYELVCVLHNMSDLEFKRHVNEERNELGIWAKDKLGDKKLASQLSKAKDKRETEAVILAKLLKEEKTGKNMLRFVCHPLLKNKMRKAKNEKNA
ncbi:hypothetical protein KY366_06625 [Candidatus Woesearchaeota archaeon]|nr:hypothetical protein [Candidatus Woesearchaeota archaeon]